MHARGEKVEAVLRKAENDDEKGSAESLAYKTDELNHSSADFEGGQASDQFVEDHHAKIEETVVSYHNLCASIWVSVKLRKPRSLN